MIFRFLAIFLLLSVGYAEADIRESANLVWMDRFNSDLSAWTKDETGGTVSIVTQDYSTKMKLDDTGGSDWVSATRSFTEPLENWNIEYDEKIVSDGDICVMELLDASNNVIASVAHGGTNDQVDFDTDDAAYSFATWNNNTYKQVCLHIDQTADTIECWILEDDATYGNYFSIGGAKSYTGATIAKMRFRTSTGTSVAYIDEVRIYTPDLFMIGDSITDGKPLWSNHPAYPTGRLAAQEDETSPPNYQLGLLMGSASTTWVANRGYGGSRLSYIDDDITACVIDQGAQRVYVSAGHNDIMNDETLANLKIYINTIVGELESAGIEEHEILLGNVAPSDFLNTTSEQSIRRAFNDWLEYLCRQNGYLYIDNATALSSSYRAESLSATYGIGDGTHLNSTGSGVIAQTVYDAMGEYESSLVVSPEDLVLVSDTTDGAGIRLFEKGTLIPMSNPQVILITY